MSDDEHVLKKSWPRISKRSLLQHVYDLARTFGNYHYATLGVNEVRIATTDGKRFKVTITEE